MPNQPMECGHWAGMGERCGLWAAVACAVQPLRRRSRSRVSLRSWRLSGAAAYAHCAGCPSTLVRHCHLTCPTDCALL